VARVLPAAVLQGPLGHAGALVLVAVLYYAAAKLALAFAIPPGYATAVWPSSGIALAVLLLLGARYWPGIWIGAALANYTIQYSAPLAAAIATGNTLEAVIAAALVRRFIGVPHRFVRGEDVVRFVAVAMAGCAVAASVATVALGTGGFMAWRDSWPNWWTWWQGDLAGLVIVTPLILTWAARQDLDWSHERIFECVAFSLVLAAVMLAVFGEVSTGDGTLSLSFLVLPLIIWASFRFSQREVATASAVMCGLAVWQTVGGSGPFVASNMNRSLLLLQAFLSTIVATGLVLSAVLEERRRAMERLRRANEEMEHFVQVAAHDLQEPLRTVVNFTDLLEARSRDRLDGEAREFLGYVVGGVTRMQRMLRDLLTFSQVDRSEARAVAVDCELAFATARESLKAAIEESRAVVTHDALPTVIGDPTHMEILFQNLVGNAVRFRGEILPRVHVGARLEGDRWVFSVRDNGIGIDPADFGRIFNMFHRVHGSDRYPGSGIGLTICKRIVERYNGRIWLESRVGSGTIFYFTAPAHPGGL
jgi:signal transduction histidine kinase